MSVYPPKIRRHLKSLHSPGIVSRANATATEASFQCGSFVSFSLRINSGNTEIEEARYRTNGCGYTVASCEVLTRWLISRRLTDLHGADKAAIAAVITAELEIFPAGRIHCYDLAIDALRESLAVYRARLVDEYRGESALICTCFGVSEDALEKCISDGGLTQVDDVIKRCRAGGGCGSCQPLIQEMIDAVRFGHMREPPI